MITTREDPVVFEVTTTLREWHTIWHDLYLEDQNEYFEKIGIIIEELIDARSELISSLKQYSAQDATSNEQQIIELKTAIVNKLDQGNRLLNLDLVPRDVNFNSVDPVELSPVKLYKLHSDPSTNANNHVASNDFTTSQEAESNANSTQTSYHLQLAMKKYYLTSLPSDELVEVYCSIVDLSNSSMSVSIKPITEKFLIQIKDEEITCGVANTIFKNLGPLINRDICLYVQVYRVGKMILADAQKTTFSKQQSSHNLQNPNHDGSTNSISTMNKYTPNGLTRSHHSTIGYFSASHSYRRPFGTALVLLKEHCRNVNSKEVNINIKVVASNESDFSQITELYSKRNHSLKSNQNLPNIQFDLALRYISCVQKATVSPYCLTEKRGFPDIVMPGDFKNDLYFTLESADFEKGGKSISKNIEASISLIDKSGIIIDNCISLGSNCDNVSSHKSCVFYHSNSPRWNESIKINVPLTKFDSAHVRIEFRHCSTKERDKKFLGFSFLPLSDEDGTVIADKSHELYLYKCDSQIWEGESLNLCKYITLPFGPNSNVHHITKNSHPTNFNHSNREIVTVSTFLLSTKLTQNRNLLNLLKWRELVKRDSKEFEEALRNFLVLKGEEIVKFLQDILDTLFDTFTYYLTSEDLTSDYSSLIFKVLIHIFLLLDEPKYQHFKPVLDTYASAHFSATLVYKGLLACVKKCLEYYLDADFKVPYNVPIQRCFKSIKYIFLFIVQSKILYSKASGNPNNEPFLDDLRHLFNLFERFLSIRNVDHIMPIQVTFLESFPGSLEQLIKVVNPHELSAVVLSLAQSVGPDPPLALQKAKLVFMKETANSSIMKSQDIRLRITEIFCRYLNLYMVNRTKDSSQIEYSRGLELSYEVLELLIVKIHDYHWPSIYRLYQLTLKSRPQDLKKNACSVMTVGEINKLTEVSQIQANQLDLAISSVSKELEPFISLMEPLFRLLNTLLEVKDHLLVQKYCTLLLTIFKLMSKRSFEKFVKRSQLDYNHLCDIFGSFRGVYNRDWSVMQLTSHSILEHPIDEISSEIRTKNDTIPYVKLVVDFITHPTLQLDAFSERKKNFVLSVFGDLRLKYSSQLIRFWTNLTPSSIYDITPTSIQSFLDAALLSNDELQKELIPVFYDMIEAEDHRKSNSRQIERCLIENLDLFINLDRGNIKFTENFDSILRRLLVERKPTWEQHGYALIESFTKLMRLLINYRQSLEGYENRSKQMSCLVELLNFYNQLNCTDLHSKYLFILCRMHLKVGNYTEAAFTLKLYTDKIKWCHRNLGPIDDRPEEQEWRRKEVLYQRIIQYFDTGKCWEETISLCKELASFYENFLVDYEKVSRTLKKLAQFLDNILTEHRPEREYFRVEFIGLDLPDFVKGKDLIYRGGGYERLAAFMQRMMSEFPDVQVLNSKSKQSITKESPGQYMIISNVKPVPFLQDRLKSAQTTINDKIIQYYRNNRLDTFSYDVPIIRDVDNSAKEKSNEINVKNLWIGRYVLKLRKQLPDILPWSEVISQEHIEISPINHAIETISCMNLELINLIQSYKNETNKQISPLTMRLQGVIEAAVNGGPAVFVDAFLKRQPDTAHDKDLLIRLRGLIEQQFNILDTGLKLHEKLAPPEVKPLHLRLVDRLDNARKTLLEEANQITENNYELVNHMGNVGGRLMNGDITTIGKFGTHESSNKDEVDHPDHNGNIYGEIDDQLYSHPIEPRMARIMSPNGTRSELSSPSRSQTSSGTSSSLSTLAVLSNLSINRARMSITPSKEINLHQHSLSSLNSNELCARAARKLTYESSKDSLNNTDTSRFSTSSHGTLSANQDAPPLPPRSFFVDKRPFSLNVPCRTMSPSLKEDLSSSCSTTTTGVQNSDQDPLPMRSNLPRLQKTTLNAHNKQTDGNPPPLPQRIRSTSSQQFATPEINLEEKSIMVSDELKANIPIVLEIPKSSANDIPTSDATNNCL